MYYKHTVQTSISNTYQLPLYSASSDLKCDLILPQSDLKCDWLPNVYLSIHLACILYYFLRCATTGDRYLNALVLHWLWTACNHGLPEQRFLLLWTENGWERCFLRRYFGFISFFQKYMHTEAFVGDRKWLWLPIYLCFVTLFHYPQCSYLSYVFLLCNKCKRSSNLRQVEGVCLVIAYCSSRHFRLLLFFCCCCFGQLSESHNELPRSFLCVH